VAGTFLILDGHSLAYRAFHATDPQAFRTSTGQYTNAVSGFLSMLAGVLKEHQPTHIAVAFDISRDTFRAKQYPEYKATRSKTPEEFAGQVDAIKRVLGALHIRVVTAEGYEADDVIATLAHHSTHPVRIVSGDRDTFQLITESVAILYPGQRMSDLKRMDDAAVFEKYGVHASQYRDLAAMVGESSDNLPGVPGVGPKTAAKWITQYGSLDEVLAVADSITGKVGEALRAHVEQVRLNYELNRLVNSVPIETNVDAYAKTTYDPREVHTLFDDMEFGRDSSVRTRLLAAWPSDEGAAAEAPQAEITVDAKELSGSALDKWLTTNGSGQTAVAFSGEWSRGTGVLGRIAVVNSSGLAVYCQASEPAIQKWLAGSSPKVTHDAKGPLLALMAQDAALNGLEMDTAVAAYVVSPGSRGFALEDLASKYLGVNVPGTSSSSGQLFDEGPSGLDLAMRARATLDLADVLSRELAQRGGDRLYREMELPLVTLLAKMERAGIAVDRTALVNLEKSFEADANQAIRAAHDAVGHEFNLGSTKQLQEVLFEERKLPKTKKTKTGFTTDADALQWLLTQVPDDELLVAILRFREVSKLKQTVTGLLACVSQDDRIHTSFNQMVAATGRLSSNEPNLQNIPVRTTEGGQIRSVFVSGDAYEALLTADYSQIELRVMAHLSQDAGLIQALKSGEDLHTTVGSQVFGVAPSEVTPDMRRQVKAMSYGLAYGLSAFGLSGQLGISTGAAKSLMDTYFERFGGVRDYLASVVVAAREAGFTESIMGRRRYLPELNSPERTVRDQAERMALNAPIQGSAADIVKVAMLRVQDALVAQGLSSRLLLQVHDELIVEVAPGEREAVAELVRHEMEHAVALTVPLDVSIGFGRSWTEAAH
jgi:DNA polymerase-1